MINQLNEMERLGRAEPADAGDDEITYAARNNNVVVVLASDGCIRLRNRGFWDELPDDLRPLGEGIRVDKINVAIYPPAASARRSLLARHFIGYLGDLIGPRVCMNFRSGRTRRQCIRICAAYHLRFQLGILKLP